jgi:hypothetical protein
VTIPEVRDDPQLTLLTASSTFGDSTWPLFISKLKKFEKMLLAAHKLHAGPDYLIRSVPKTFITELLVIDWLESILLPRISELRTKFTYDYPSLLVLEGHSIYVTARVIALCAARKITLIKLVSHSSHLAQPLDSCVFGLFKILYKKERQSKGMKGETRKFYRPLLAFYKSIIILMVHCNFERARFPLNASNLLGAMTVDSTPGFERIDVPELLFNDTFLYPELLHPKQLQ